ncbi:uncharacterized protein LOC132745819 [Ruditapes philippinarum]|uniref:uncharacterized protein LOC132745819 n=1 Tax=Ruditapes philippinarum TaxID=129788 RepID=UPI00295BD327|nr:uncharacterized protein LOC132745819 [Ruditapes philippinarum]
MFQSTDSRKHISLMLSEVLNDIGVNDRMVMKARRNFKLMETMFTVSMKPVGSNSINYFLGSHSEGTTTLGLKSDFDMLTIDNSFNVIKDLSEWELSKINYLMIQDETTTPGYCFLQLTESDKPFLAVTIPNYLNITDRKGRILLKNTIYDDSLHKTYTAQHGPSFFSQGINGYRDSDSVVAFPCKSWPKSASCWLERQGKRKMANQEY